MSEKEAVKMQKRWMVIGTVTALVLALSMSLAYGSGRWGNHQNSGPAVSHQVMHGSGQALRGFAHHDWYWNHDGMWNHDGYRHHDGHRNHDGYRHNDGYRHHDAYRQHDGMWTSSGGTHSHHTRHSSNGGDRGWSDCNGHGGSGWP